MWEDLKRERESKLFNEINAANTSNVKAMKAIGDVEPKYAKHMFLRNELLEKFAMRLGGGINILDQPVCTRCERPAAWDENGSAYCFSCNKSIAAKDVITVTKYLMEYTKAFTVEELEILNELGGSKDEIIR